MYEKRNQAYTMHPDFFDPLHQYASLEMNPKDPEFVKVQYHHEEPSVTVNEDGSVTTTEGSKENKEIRRAVNFVQE